MEQGDLFIMGTNIVDPMPSPSKKKTHGSVKSMKSLGGISIFQDPEAGTTLPRDVEMTLTMYDQPVAEENRKSYTSNDDETRVKRYSGSSQQSSSVISGSNMSNGDVVVNGVKSSSTKVTNKDKGGYTFTYSQTVSESSGTRDSSSGSTTLPHPKKSTKSVVKTGSFQMKSAYDYSPVAPASTASATRSETKSKGLSGGSFSMINGKGQVTTQESKASNKEMNGHDLGHTSEHYSSKTSVTSQSAGVNGDLKWNEGNQSDSKSKEMGYAEPKAQLERRDSELTNVSSLTSYSVSESYQKKSGSKQEDASDKKWTKDASQISTSLQSVNRSDSQKSETKTVSKAPSLSSMHEYNKMIITEVYKDDIYDSDRGSIGKVESKSAESTLESKKSGKKMISETKIITTGSASSSKEGSKEASGSKSASIVQNKEFRDKMSTLFKSHSKSKVDTNSVSVSSSASSTMARGPEKTFRNDVHLEIKTDIEKRTDDTIVHSATFPRTQQNYEIGYNRPISPEPVSPVKEMKETIKFGTVGSLVKDKFKNLNLTGRSIDPSTIERQKSKPSTDSPSAETGDQKKYKFLIEGIDYPEKDVPVDSSASETVEGELSAGSPDTDDGTLSPTNTKKRDLTKKGFSYVLDQQLASAIIKKAEDVQARKPHEALEVKTKDTQWKEAEESEVLVEAKAKLKHEESFSGRKSDYKARTPQENALLKDIRSRLVRPQSTLSETNTLISDDKVEKHVEEDTHKTSQEEVIKTITTEVKTEDTDLNASANTQQESIMSSVTTIDSTITTTSQDTIVTSQDEIPMSENKLIYDGFKYEIMNKDTSVKDQPKSYSQVFKAEAVSPRGSAKRQSEISKEEIKYNSTELYTDKRESVVSENNTISPRVVTVKYSPELSSKKEHISPQTQPSNSYSKTIETKDTVITTEVKSLRDMNKYNNDNERPVFSNTVITPTEHELKSESSSSASSIKEQAIHFSQENFDRVPSSNRSSISSESTLSQQSDIDRYDYNVNVVEEEEIVPKKKVKDELNIIITDDRTRNNDIQNYTDTAHMMDGYSHSVGTNVKTPLYVSPPRHVSHNDLLDEDTKASYKNGVTSERPIKTSGRHASELYIEVNGGKHSVYDQHQQGGILSVNTSNTRDQEVFYTGGHLSQQSDDVTVQRVKSSGGQLYTSIYKKNKHQPSGSSSYEEQRSPKGGHLYVRHSPHTSGLPSPRYPASESTHNSTSSGAVSSPEFREDLFYQPHRSRANQWSNVSRSSSSVTGSVHSHRSDGVYVYRTDTKHGRKLSDLGHKVVHLKPVKASNRRNQELKTHPTFYSPNTSMMSSPVVMSDFETNMNATSTLRPNTDTGFIHIIDSGSVNNVKVQRDENMNYTSPPSPSRMLTVDEVSRGRIPIRRGMKVSTINIEGDDAFSGVSDPTFSRNNKYRVQKVMDVRRANNEFATPVDMHPDTAYKKQKFYSVQRTSSSPQKPPEVEVELDPHLQEAKKQGRNYNVTMKLNASVLGLKSGGSRSEDMFREEYVEESLYKNSNSMRGPPLQFSPRAQSSMSVSDESVVLSPGSRSKTNITLIDDYQTSPPPIATSNNIEHLRFKQFINPPPQINVTSTTNSVNVNEAYLRPSSNNNVPQRSPNNNNSTGTAPKFSMSIDQTMTMDYVPSDQENDNITRQPANEPMLQRQNAPNNRKPPKQRRKKPVMEQDRMMVNGDLHTNYYDDDDDLEQYLSPAEEEFINPKRSDTANHGYGYPQVVRGSILIKNAIDTTGAPKVVDVVEGDTESEDDDTLIHDNVNPFDGQYFQARENPMYSSDPDLRAAYLREQQENKPKFTQLFGQTESSRNNTGRFNSFENEDYDTEIKVTRVSSEHAAGPAKKQKVTKSENTYVYNGYDHPDRGAGAGAGAGASSSSSKSRRDVSKSENRTEFEIQRLLKNAPPGSIKQTINVEREEEEILGPLPNGDDGTGPDSLLNFDTISEKVDLGMTDGAAQVAVKVKCERIVPIRGVEDMFKKSSVIVTRLIEIDLMVTEERKKLYEHITNKSRNMVTSGGGDGKSRSSRGGMSSSQQKLSTKDTFKLYKTFMGMAEADEHGKNIDNLRIDRKIEEQNRPDVQAKANLLEMDVEENGAFEIDTDALDRQLEQQLIAHAMRPPEPDTISYMSAASEMGDILY